MSRFLTAVAALTAITMPAARAELPELPQGSGRVVFDDWAGPAIDVHTFVPDGVGANTPVVFVMHGTNRNADDYRDAWIDIAQACGIVVVAPAFDRRHFPGAAGYNLGEPLERAPDVSAFDAIEPLYLSVRERLGLREAGYGLFGHSAGAQFVHRYMMLTPDTHVTRAVAANAGWYTWPDSGIDWPYGLGGSPREPLDQADITSLPLTLLLGEEDRDPDASNLRRTPEAMAQGESRFRRGIRTAALVDYMAARLGRGSGWNLATVPGVAHDYRGMTPPAVRFLVPQRTYDRPACRQATGGE